VSIATAAAALIMERALIGSTVTQIRCCARGERCARRVNA
jgi:hypothetical protein